SEVYQHGVTVTSLAPSQVVPTPGTVHHKLVASLDDPKGEPPTLMALAALLLVTEPSARVSGRVTYSQQILKEFGWITEARRRGAAAPRRSEGPRPPAAARRRHRARPLARARGTVRVHDAGRFRRPDHQDRAAGRCHLARGGPAVLREPASQQAERGDRLQ